MCSRECSLGGYPSSTQGTKRSKFRADALHISSVRIEQYWAHCVTPGREPAFYMTLFCLCSFCHGRIPWNNQGLSQAVKSPYSSLDQIRPLRNATALPHSPSSHWKLEGKQAVSQALADLPHLSYGSHLLMDRKGHGESELRIVLFARWLALCASQIWHWDWIPADRSTGR